MAEQTTVEVGNALIVLAGSDHPLSGGRTTGYLEFYDERHRPCFPLTSQAIHDHFLSIMNEPSPSSLWKAGHITGWREALMENSPHTFRSFPPQERITVLQEV